MHDYPITFDALRVALELARALRPLIATLERRDKDLVRQIRRTISSVVLNTGEGRERRGADRLHLFRCANGSAAEVA